MNLTRLIVWGLTALVSSGAVALKMTEPDGASNPFRGKHQSESFAAVGSLHLVWEFDDVAVEGGPFCSAVLIDSDTALTAAHCYAAGAIARFGEQSTEVEWILPEATDNHTNDIAVLHLEDEIDAVPLALFGGAISDLVMGDRMIQLGYGLGERYQTDFFAAPFFGTINGTDWLMWFAMHSQLNPGDSGGAVIMWCTETDQHVLIGIAVAAWVDRGNNRHYANFATRIDIHKEWIDDNRNGN